MAGVPSPACTDTRASGTRVAVQTDTSATQNPCVSELTREHAAIIRLLDTISSLEPGPQRTQLIDEAGARFLTHAEAEERHLYPALRLLLPDGSGEAREQAKRQYAVGHHLADRQQDVLRGRGGNGRNDVEQKLACVLAGRADGLRPSGQCDERSFGAFAQVPFHNPTARADGRRTRAGAGAGAVLLTAPCGITPGRHYPFHMRCAALRGLIADRPPTSLRPRVRRHIAGTSG
jgi:hypothetical protein